MRNTVCIKATGKGCGRGSCNEGLSAFSDIQALELLLFYSIPTCRIQTLTAHRLLERFGSLRHLFEADMWRI